MFSILSALPLLVTMSTSNAAIFEIATNDWGLNGMYNEQSAFGDYDNDGDPDLLTLGQLWRNDGGTFFGVYSPAAFCPAMFADFDNDGLLEIYTFCGVPIIFKQDGAAAYGWDGGYSLPTPPMSATRGASIADFNGDGFLDIYVTGYEAPGYEPDAMWFNNGDGTFTLAWTEAVTAKGWYFPGRGVTSCDFDEDFDMDIYVSNYRIEGNYLWRNNGAGWLTDHADVMGVIGDYDGWSWSYGHTIGSAWGDLDNDGHFDLFVGNFAHSDYYQDRSKFLRNTFFTTGGFTEDSVATNALRYQESYASPALIDYNNDGHNDLYFTTVYAGDYPVLYKNYGDFDFSEVDSGHSGLSYIDSTYQNAWADVDLDGDLDVVTGGNLYINNTTGTQWLEVRLEGNGSSTNRSAVGAQVRIETTMGTLVRQVEIGTGEGNSNDQVLHFGLGSDAGPFDLNIRWPDGHIQEAFAVDANQLVYIVQCDDADGDGYNDISCGGDDCDDSAAGINPSAPEYCDGIDNNCDLVTDGPDALDAALWYFDADGDTYGDGTSTMLECTPPSGYVDNSADCDDSEANHYPGADETCDGVDNNCNGIVDEAAAVDVLTWFRDGDGDGYGGPKVSTDACNLPDGFSADNTDCDDADATIYPGADEYCDGVDNNCDTTIDETTAVDTLIWFSDGDGDGYGDPKVSANACEPPRDFSADNTDCDDTEAITYPGADEHCDEQDNDCDGEVDEAPALGSATWYADADSDGFGDWLTSEVSCEAPDGTVENPFDCDDADETINPDADELCDDVDNDCDGDVDEQACADSETPAPGDTEESAGCGCSSSGLSMTWPLLALLLPWYRKQRLTVSV
jgi:hypothetical protein